MSPKRIVLHFNAETSDKPMIYRLVKDFDLVINIVKANVNPQKEGTMVLEVEGEQSARGLDYLRQLGVTIEDLNREIIRNEDKCVMCGACTAICPTAALKLERPSMEVSFNGDECVVCELCIKICPVRAMEVSL